MENKVFLFLTLAILSIGYTEESSCKTARYTSLNGDLGVHRSYTIAQCCDYCDGTKQFKNHKTSKTSRHHYVTWQEHDGGCNCDVTRSRTDYYCYCPEKSHQLVPQNHEYHYVYNYYRPLETNNANMSFTESTTLSIVHRTKGSSTTDTTSFYAIDYLTEPTAKSGRLYITNAEEIEDDKISLDRKTQHHEVTKVHNSIYKTYSTSDTTKIHMYEVKIKASEVIKNAPNNISLILVHATKHFITLDLLKKNINSVSTRSCQLLIDKTFEHFRTNLYHIMVTLKPDELCTSDVTDVAISMQVEDTLRIVDYQLTELSVDPTNFTYTANGALVKIDRLFIHSRTELTFIITPTNNTNFTMSKDAVVFSIFTASVQVDDKWTHYTKELDWKVHLSNIEQPNVYYIMDRLLGLCLQYYSDGSVIASRICSPFIYTDKTFKLVGGTCIIVDSQFNLMSGHCDEAAIIDIVDRNLYHVERKKFLTRNNLHLGSTYNFRQNFPDGLPLEAIFNSGLQISSAKVLKHHRRCGHTKEKVSFVNNIGTVHYCSTRSTGPNCMSKVLTSGETKTYPESICLIIGVDTTKSSIYGLDFNGKLIQYDDVERITYVDVMEPWDHVKTKNTTIVGQVYGVTDLFNNPSTYTINDVDYNLTYYGLQRLRDQSSVIYWMEELCGKYVAKLKSDSFESCLAIKNACRSAESGWYWLHGRAGSHVLQGYCEMNTDGGGWLLFVNYTLPDGQHFVINKTEDLNEMLKPLSYPTSQVGLQILLDWYVPFTSMRFYCFTDKPGRTLHFKTLHNRHVTSNDFYRYFVDLKPLGGCATYQTFQDDNSAILHSCHNWATRSGSHVYWGAKYLSQQRLYVLLVNTKEGQWNFGHGEWSVCDSLQTDYNYGEWKIFLR